MAHKKGQGSTRNGRDSGPQYRGVKAYGGEHVQAGSILVRQVGSSFHPGLNVGVGKDFTLWARIEGTVKYGRQGRGRKGQERRIVSIVPLQDASTSSS